SSSGNASVASRNNSVRAKAACCPSDAVSKISLKRTRNRYSVRNWGICVKSCSSFARSCSVKHAGSRRISQSSDRNTLRSARDSFALYARVIFFSQPVEGLIPQLGHVKTVRDALGVGEQRLAGVVERLPHVHPVAAHLSALS